MATAPPESAALEIAEEAFTIIMQCTENHRETERKKPARGSEGRAGSLSSNSSLLEAHFELAFEEFEKALKLAPASGPILTLCARACIKHACFQSLDVSRELLARGVGFFEAAMQGTGYPQDKVLHLWGSALLELASMTWKFPVWWCAALRGDALEKFERSYSLNPDTTSRLSPVVGDWMEVLSEQRHRHPHWSHYM